MQERRGAVLYGWIEGEQSDLVGVATDNNSFPAVHEQQQLVNVVERSGGEFGHCLFIVRLSQLTPLLLKTS